MATTYKTQDGDEIRTMTTDEITALELAHKEVEAREKEAADRQALRTATLAKLGLNADEIAALLS
jgi:DNA-binding protein H-NS